MNIFNSLKKSPYSLSSEEKHLNYLKYRGITEEEYQLELKRKHEEYLKNLGITEEEFQKREANKAKRKAIKEALWNKYGIYISLLALLLVFSGGMALLYGFGLLLDFLLEFKIIKILLFIIGTIFVICVFSRFLVFLYVTVYSYISSSKLVATIITILIFCLFIFLVGQCSKYTDYEPRKLRPERLR